MMDFKFLLEQVDTGEQATYLDWFIKGVGFTVSTSTIAFLLSLFFAVIMGSLMSLDGRKGKVARAFNRIALSIPLVASLYIYYQVIPAVFFKEQLAVWNNTVLILISGTIALTQLMSARIAGHVYSALKAIPEDQKKSAKAQGLSTYHTYKLLLIPQALKKALPSITGEAKNTFKNSAALKLIGLMEVCGMMEQVINSTAMTIESFVICLVIYLILNSLVDLASYTINKIFK